MISAILAGSTVFAGEAENHDLSIPDEILITDDMQMPDETLIRNGKQEPDIGTPDGQLILEDIQEEADLGATEASRVYLGIDTAHVYENMDSSYSQGYIPKVENGTVHLVVPFLASGPLKNDCLDVELDLGENAPFVYANYRKEVRRSELYSGETPDPVETYLFCCDIALESNRRNGKYPVMVRAVGYSEAGYRAELTSRIFITVADGRDPGSDQTEAPEPGTQTPPGQTDPGEPDTEGPPLIVPDDPGGDSGSAGSGDEGGGQDPGQNGGQSGETDPGGSKPGEPGTEEPGTEQPPTTEPPAEEPGTEEPATEEPGTKEPLTEEPDTEEALPNDLGAGGGYSGGGYAGGGDTVGSVERVHRQPKFLLLSDSLDDEQLTAGQEYAFTTVFQNVTGDEPVYNMKVTLKTESEAIDFSCSSFYFGKVRAQETVSLPTCLSVKPNAQAGKAAVLFDFDYENDQGTAYTATEEVELDIYQPSQLVLEGFRLAPQLYSTDTVDGNFTVHNAGKAAVYNVRIDFAGQGLFSTGSAFAGNLEAGASYEGALRIYVGNKMMKSLGDTGTASPDGAEEGDAGTAGSDGAEEGDAGAAGSDGAEEGDAGAAGSDGAAAGNTGSADEKYGQTTGTLTLTYEDAYGEIYTQTQEFATEILEPQVVKLSVEKPEEQTNQWQAAVLVLTCAVFLLILAFMGWRLRRSKNALADLLAAQRDRNA